jgi:CheY-like chemotaxis protein
MKKVLIIDGEKSFLLSLEERFDVHDDKFSLMIAASGLEAVEFLREGSIDLLVTELEIAEIDGFELLAWVNQLLPELPVIIMTGEVTEEIKERLSSYRVLEYLQKPFEIDVLEKTILDGLGIQISSPIRGFDPSSFLQLIHLEKKTCGLKVTSEKGTGFLYLSQGKLVDAEWGEVKGEEAARDIVCWENTEIEMINLCLRKDGPIKSSMESILLSAYICNDENRPEPKLEMDITYTGLFLPEEIDGDLPVDQKKTLLPALSEEARDQLVSLVSSNGDVSEFALFDRHSVVERHNSGESTLQAIDPAIYLYLTDNLDEYLGFGACRWISFFTARRSSFLLFKLAGYSLLVKLRQGADSRRIGIKLNNMIDGIVATG